MNLHDIIDYDTYKELKPIRQAVIGNINWPSIKNVLRAYNINIDIEPSKEELIKICKNLLDSIK